MSPRAQRGCAGFTHTPARGLAPPRSRPKPSGAGGSTPEPPRGSSAVARRSRGGRRACGVANSRSPDLSDPITCSFIEISTREKSSSSCWALSTLADLVAEAVRASAHPARALPTSDHESRRSREPGVASRVADVAVFRRPRWELGRRSAQGEPRARRRRAERNEIALPKRRPRQTLAPAHLPPCPLLSPFPTDRS